MTEPKRTALHAWHERQGAKMVDFHGWRLPVQYTGLMDEHRAVRAAAGLFDVSHMGEILVRGPGALEGVQRLVTNDCAKLADGQILYTVACREDGGVLDDLLVYRLGEEAYQLVVNAGNREKLAAWTASRLSGLDVADVSDTITQVAIQGPLGRDILCECPLFAAHAAAIRALPFYAFFNITLEGRDVILSRTGYTGELGFEIYAPDALAEPIADALLETGGERLVPAGLGARDTLRFEASYCLYGNELDEDVDPYEAGLFWLVKLDKGDFIGRDALRARKDDPEARRLVGFALGGRKIARHGFPVHDETGAEAGKVTSGTFAPSLERSLGMALVKRARRQGPLSVAVRGELLPAELVKLPFYSQPALRA